MTKIFIKKTLLFFCIFILVVPLFAHEFWLQPDKFIYQRGDEMNIHFLVGENFEGENWTGNNEKVKSLKLYMGETSDDIVKDLSENKGDSLQFGIYDECTAMVTFNSTNSFIELSHEMFNDYLKEDRLQNAIDYRNKFNEKDSAGREFYQRSAKTIIQIGMKKNNVSIATDLPLDIIPAANPYNFKNNDSVIFKILFNKNPLTNYSVKVWNRNKDETYRQEIISDDKGEIKFKITTSGKWMISAVNMIRLENNEKANWQSYWGSCTWGYAD